MNKTLKKFVAAFVTAILAVCFSVPFSAFANENTLGVEEPYLYCAFKDSNENAVDGNSLTAGTYEVNIVLSGMETLSIFEFTAKYDPAVITALSIETPFDGAQSGITCGGTKDTQDTDGKNILVAAFASKDEYCTAIDADGETMATLTVTIDTASSIDFRDYFRFSTDPDLTFACADYRDGYEDAYVLDTSVQTEYNTYLMTADESPAMPPSTITVSGKVLIATDATGTASEFGLRGVKIYAYDNEENVIAETVSNATGDVSTWGDYTLTVPAGTTQFMVGDYASDTIVNRPFTINGDADVSGADVAVVMCDYNDDSYINVVDKTAFNKAVSGTYSIYADFNNDEFANVVDKTAFNKILKAGGAGITYSELHFE